MWYVDIGEYDRALTAFHRASSVLKGTEARLLRLNLAYNLGELHLLIGEIDRARREFNRAQELDGPGMPGNARALVQAGLGLAALYEGDLKAARLYESNLPPDPEEWSFEPSLIVRFRSRMLERRGKREEAVDYLLKTADGFETRFVTSWIKSRLLASRIASRSSPLRARQIAEPAYRRAVELGLDCRKEQLAKYI